MDKFYTSNSDEYYAETDRREKIYRENCEISGKLWDEYEKNNSNENHRKFFDFFPNVDKSYKNWTEGVFYIYKDE